MQRDKTLANQENIFNLTTHALQTQHNQICNAACLSICMWRRPKKKKTHYVLMFFFCLHCEFYLNKCHYCMLWLSSALPTDYLALLLLKHIVFNLRWNAVRGMLSQTPPPPLPALISVVAAVYDFYPLPQQSTSVFFVCPFIFFSCVGPFSSEMV